MALIFESLVEIWSKGGLSAVQADLDAPILIPLEPWIRRADTRRALRTIGTPGPPILDESDFKSPRETTSEATAPVLRLVHSRLGDRYPAGQIPILSMKKTERNVYAYVAVGRSVNNDVVVDQPSVSRFHADLRLIEGVHHVRDAKSHNGTRLNGEPVTSNRGDPLHAGDVISFGEAACVFCDLSEISLRLVLGEASH